MTIRELLQSDLTILLDGGMGTMLQAAGLQPGVQPESWNLTNPQAILDIQKAYFDAGANIVNANTFGANALHFSHEELPGIIAAGIRIAKEAAAQSTAPGPKFAALDLGPTGKLLRPYGDLDFEDAVAVFAEAVRLGAEAGADLVMIETMNDSYETKAALLAAKENCHLPVFVSNAYGADGKLMTGASPEAMAAMLEGMGADAIGVNCSLGPAALAPIVRRYLACASVPVLMKPNAGLPREEEGRTVYDVDAEAFTEAMLPLFGEGLRIAGGCCGTTPDFIRLLAERAPKKAVSPAPHPARTVVSSYTHAVVLDGAPVLIGERINPTGKKRFRQALQEHDIGYVLGEAIRQQEAGAHMLDVNVGTPGIDEKALLTEVTQEVQAVIDLPLQLDTSDPAAMESALRRYNGKAMINSVNGKAESMAAIFPLVKKYGGVTVALTLDEQGIPADADGRVAIARRILETAAGYGIGREDLVFDTLTMTVSADPDAAKTTLEAMRRIREELGCRTVLGVSNVSFGLPNREMIGSAFFLEAMAAGLSAAIMNPCADAMMAVYRSWCALNGFDPQCGAYIAFASAHAALPAAAAAPQPADSGPAQGATPLQRAVVKGLKGDAARLTAELIASGADPMDAVKEHVIPALNLVGEGFEKKTIFLPQLLMSAEAAEAAFRKVKAAVGQAGGEQPRRCKVVLATVKGDIHDIGKNIVRLLLENYGFQVIDLGRDVPPETIVAAAVREQAPLIGLSALMTTTVPAMEETIRLAREKAPHIRVLVGGAVLTEAYAKRIGADAYAPDAMATVRYAEAVDAGE